MEEEKILKSLHDHEKRIIKALQGKRKANLDELLQATNLKKDSVEKATSWLETKGILKIYREPIHFVELTEEGLEYAEHGLPEKKLLDLLAKEEQEIEKLKKTFDKFNIALVWLKKNGWAEIKEGKLHLTEKGKEALTLELPEERVLSALKEGRMLASKFDEEILKRLERRGLIKRRQEVKKEFSLTEFGRKIAPSIELKEEIGQLTPQILRSKKWKKKPLRAYDIKLPVPKTFPGKKHFLTQVIEYIRKIWLEMGFKEMKGPIIEVSFWNFDALYQPQDHPARDLADTLYMKVPEKGKLPNKELVEAVKATHEYGWTCNSTGWQYKWDPEFAKKCVLRTHTTSLSARTLAKLREDIKNEALPAKYFSVGRCFRNETLDWKHLIEFYQTDGIVVDENVNFRHLLGYLKRFFSKLGFPKARFRPSYFPYTEMSVEIEVLHPDLKKWIELGGAGMFRSEVVKPLLGRDIPVLAWGPGFERLVMINYGIKDIRELYWNDLKQLREVKLWLK